MINEFIQDIKEMKTQLSEESCLKKEPFIKLGSGQAPVLNYNIPQSACFNTYGHQFVKGIDQNVFLEQTKVKPPQNYFEVVQQTPEPQLRQRFAEAVQLQRTDDVLIPNSAILRKHISLVDSNLKAVALAATPVMGEPVKDGSSTDAVIPQQAFIFDKVNAINEVQLTRLAKEGFRPMVMEKLGGYETQVKYVKEPAAPVPYFAIMEEYTTCSYLGDYGAGRTIKTFSLLPGEKTTITVRTYKEKASTKSNSENVLDSFSESSTNELEKLIENETGLSSNSTSGSSSSTSKTRKGNVGGNIGASLFGIINIGVSGGYEGGSSKSSTNSSSATRASNIRSVNKALDKHISNSNSNRTIDINTTTTESYTEGEESSTVREIVNINKSRVLNFVFRQLLQQYVTITSLSNIKIAFCNGYEESLRVVDLEELDVLLEDTVVPDMVEQVRQTILKHYCTIFNYKDEPIQFVEKVTYNIGECVAMNEEETFWRIRRDIIDTWRADEGGLEIKVKGPILNVSTHTLKTSSAVVDAFLGQGEALDCYNMKIQDADAINSQLSNIELLQQLETIQNIDDPAHRAELYKKVFGSCCSTPQTQIIS
ncbi:hypothetical protein [Sphingobacterium sp.]|uniref:hypothetical protein n=1 Tax=Sphingobacterium sp. TaxID=341027 RepID=UPI0028A20C47|nr:hypothetical protein [Sphingobacterium sp.]